jgi:L-ascorbate 6-phosphate lactonase
MDLAFRISSTRVKKDEIAIFWLGQAGFVIKDSEDRIIAIDPYLSDCCERAFGFKRIMPKLITPYDLDLDILITSHDHMDHFDNDSIPILMSNGRAKIFGSVTAVKVAEGLGIDKGRMTAMKPGDKAKLDGITIKAVYADHGELAPDALGIIIELEKIKIYYVADTSYNPEVVKTVKKEKPDIIIVPINGEFGNLNSQEAARLVKDSGAKMAIPCHFWTFIRHRGDPQQFEDEMKKQAPDCGFKFFQQGEMLKYRGYSDVDLYCY